jgi:hypothetical protein
MSEGYTGPPLSQAYSHVAGSGIHPSTAEPEPQPLTTEKCSYTWVPAPRLCGSTDPSKGIILYIVLAARLVSLCALSFAGDYLATISPIPAYIPAYISQPQPTTGLIAWLKLPPSLPE